MQQQHYLERYRPLFGSEFNSFLQAIEGDLLQTLRPNLLRVKDFHSIGLHDRYPDWQFKKVLPDIEAYQFSRPQRPENAANTPKQRFSLGKSLESALGQFYIQGLSSMLPVLELAPTCHEKVLDLAAAPGGKTIFMAELMQNKGLIVANEVNLDRMRILKANLEKMGVCNTVVTQNRGELFPGENIFDRVLLDGPCSSEGTWRLNGTQEENRDTEWNAPQTEFRDYLRNIQQRLILRAFRLLRPGGTMIYSTCTYAPEENEAIVSWLLNKEPSAKIVPLSLQCLKGEREKLTNRGLENFEGAQFHPDLVEACRLYPHRFPSWGFFFVKITKI